MPRKKSRMEIDYRPPAVDEKVDRLCGTENCDLRVRFYPNYGWSHINNNKADRNHHALPGVFEYPEVVAITDG